MVWKSGGKFKNTIRLMDSWASLCIRSSVERLVLEKICSSELGGRTRACLNAVAEDETVSQKDVKQKACEILKTSGTFVSFLLQ